MQKEHWTRQQLQELIEQAGSDTSAMLSIGESYIRGDVLKDLTAAEAWLTRVLESGDTPEAVRAMKLLGKDIWKKEELISEADFHEIERELKLAKGEKREVLLELLALKRQE